MGGKTGRTTQQIQIPPEVMARYNAVNELAQKTAENPFQQYGKDASAFVAPINQQQNFGISGINNAANMAQPAFGAAMSGTYNAAQAMDPSKFGAGVQNYMNPYLERAVGATAAQMNNVHQQQQQQMLGSMVGLGAFGGDRSNMGLSALMNQQNLAMGQTIAGMENEGFQNAAQNYFTGRGQQGQLYKQIGDIGANAQNAALQGAQAQIGAGTLQQQTEQAGKSALYNQFQQQQAYPFQVAQFLANIAEGTGALSGQTTTTTQPVGFFSGLFKDGGRISRSSGGLAPSREGGAVHWGHFGEGYADGGAPSSYSDMVMQQLFGGLNPEAGMYGSGSGMPGGKSYVPRSEHQNYKLPEIASPPPAETSQGSINSLLNDIRTGQELYEKGREAYHQFQNMMKASGGRVGFAAGGVPYDETGSYVPPPDDSVIQRLKSPDPLPNSQHGGGLGTLFDIGKTILPFFLASGGVAGRHGYAVDGAVTDDEDNPFSDPAILARARRAAIPAAPEVPTTSAPTMASPTMPEEKTGYQSWKANNKSILDRTSVLGGLEGQMGDRSLAGQAYDWFAKTPSQIEQANADRQHQNEILLSAKNWYENPENWNLIASNPEELKKVQADPISYWQSKAAAEAPSQGGLSPASATTTETPLVDKTIGLRGQNVNGLAGSDAYQPEPKPVVSGLNPPKESLYTTQKMIAPKPGYNPIEDVLMPATRQVESTNNYLAVGPLTEKGNRAYGAYQVMDFNIPKWTKKWLGKSLTINEFLHDKDAQDAVARGQMGEYYKNQGNLNDVISMWFSGKPYNKAGNVRDITGTSVPEYLRKTYAAMSDNKNPPTSIASGLGASSPSGLIPAVETGTAQARPGGLLSRFENALMGNTAQAKPGLLLPFLQGLGVMAGSRNRNALGAIAEGLGAGAGAYSNRQQQLANLEQTQATTNNIRAQAVKESIFTDKNDVSWVQTTDPNRPWVPFAEFATDNTLQSPYGANVDQAIRSAGLKTANENVAPVQETGAPSGSLLSPQEISLAKQANPTRRDENGKLVSNPQALGSLMNQYKENLNALKETSSRAVADIPNLNEITNETVTAISKGEIGAYKGWWAKNVFAPLKSAAESVNIDTSNWDNPAARNEILNKLATQSTEMRNNPELSRAYERYKGLKEINPNLDMQPQSAAAITSMLNVQNQRDIDRDEYYAEYARYSNGSLKSAEKALNSHFNYASEQKELSNLYNLAQKNPAVAKFIAWASAGVFNRQGQQDAEFILREALGPSADKIIQRNPHIMRYFTR